MRILFTILLLVSLSMKSHAQEVDNTSKFIFVGYPERIQVLDSLINTAHFFALNKVDYQEAFQKHFGIDPLTAETRQLIECSVANGLSPDTATTLSRDGLLDFLIGVALGPTLGQERWVALTHYPASQAALAELDPQDSRVALRFEFYGDGIELANGFQELGDAVQQRERFIADNAERLHRRLPTRSLDEHLLAALDHGLPPSAGVAVGFDRLLMVASGAEHIRDVMTFTTEHA